MSRPCVFIVNSHQDTLDMFCAFVEGEGFRAITFSESDIKAGTTDLVAEVEGNGPVAIVWDIPFPYRPSLELVERIRKDPVLKAVPFIYTTTHKPFVEQIGFNEPVFELLQKPYDFDAMVKSIRSNK